MLHSHKFGYSSQELKLETNCCGVQKGQRGARQNAAGKVANGAFLNNPTMPENARSSGGGAPCHPNVIRERSYYPGRWQPQKAFRSSVVGRSVQLAAPCRLDIPPTAALSFPALLVEGMACIALWPATKTVLPASSVYLSHKKTALN